MNTIPITTTPKPAQPVAIHSHYGKRRIMKQDVKPTIADLQAMLVDARIMADRAILNMISVGVFPADAVKYQESARSFALECAALCEKFNQGAKL